MNDADKTDEDKIIKAFEKIKYKSIKLEDGCEKASTSETGTEYCRLVLEPGCRNKWHIHKAEKGGSQMLVGVAGRGWYQEEGKNPVERFLR